MMKKLLLLLTVAIAMLALPLAAHADKTKWTNPNNDFNKLHRINLVSISVVDPVGSNFTVDDMATEKIISALQKALTKKDYVFDTSIESNLSITKEDASQLTKDALSGTYTDISTKIAPAPTADLKIIAHKFGYNRQGEFETMKNVLILSGSPRKGGNSDLLCDEFMRGAKESGNNVTKINVASKKIAPCHACYFCGEHGGECVYKDDMAEILQAMIDADVLVLASPVYFYSIDAQLKAVIDRTVARWLEVKNKEFYYIMTAADEDKSSMDTTLACFRGYADCVNGAKEMGVIYGTGVYEKGKVLNTPAMAEAYEMGKNV